MNILFRKLLCIFIFFHLLGCEHVPEHIYFAHAFMDSYIKKMEKSEHILLAGSGGAFIDQINELDFSFDLCKECDIEQSRLILVRIIEDLLCQINSDIKMRPFLHEYPFTAKSLTYQLSFTDKFGDFVDPPYISMIMLKNGMVYYLVNKPDKPSMTDVYEEPYEEALRIYKEQTGK